MTWQKNATAYAEMEAAAALPDIKAQPGPEEPLPELPGGMTEAAGGGPSDVYWPTADQNAPDYAYLANEASQDEFQLTPSAIDTLLKFNRYDPDRSPGVVAFGLRGAQLASGHEVEMTSSVTLKDARPNHRNFRCVMGFYFTDENKLSVFTGSTVPCRRAVWGYANGLSASNMLPTGMHPMYIWRHKSLRPALRMGVSSDDPETGARATVLRNKNDLSLGTRDIFDLSRPLDNVHCSYYTDYQDYYGAYFSSWGCLTVRGASSPSHQWKKFQAVLTKIGARQKVELLLATGKDIGLISESGLPDSVLERTMAALRRGSKGDEVKTLQSKIGMTGSNVDGDFGPRTLEVFTGKQRELNQMAGNGPVADGIYSQSFDTVTGWNIFSLPVSS